MNDTFVYIDKTTGLWGAESRFYFLTPGHPLLDSPGWLNSDEALDAALAGEIDLARIPGSTYVDVVTGTRGKAEDLVINAIGSDPAAFVAWLDSASEEQRIQYATRWDQY